MDDVSDIVTQIDRRLRSAAETAPAGWRTPDLDLLQRVRDEIVRLREMWDADQRTMDDLRVSLRYEQQAAMQAVTHANNVMALSANARSEALEEAAAKCESMADQEIHGDTIYYRGDAALCAVAIRALKDKPHE